MTFSASHPKIEAVPFYDTAGSVKHVIASELSDAAGIAGRKAASEYSGKILQSGIEDDKNNFTRFFLIRKLDLGREQEEGKCWLPSPDTEAGKQDLDRVPGQEHARRSVQVAQRVCATRYQLEQD